jgi:hypothetical protein
MPPPCFSALPRGGQKRAGEKRYRKIWCTMFRRQFFWTREFMDNAPSIMRLRPSVARRKDSGYG